MSVHRGVRPPGAPAAQRPTVPSWASAWPRSPRWCCGHGWTRSRSAAFRRRSRWVLSNFGWLFVVAADVLLSLVLAFSRFGRTGRGSHDLWPEFGNLAWIAMMFSAGTGIGVMFHGVGEPLTHYLAPRQPVVSGPNQPQRRPPLSSTRSSTGPSTPGRSARSRGWPWPMPASAKAAATASALHSCPSSAPSGPKLGRGR